ncbi:hypothetical protein EDEG_02284 [Edhazardia aedis USNM 41457]|uniref:Uncharacterized protein n=1 Tax=Edhazardia aedis (strain USNM 41457) TaxID=1003232 RepID=J9D764_EDHAE|nr:hypothetical protein EDEG_02284 [Edhazardia aedis USNM 41457]|eukprot:EJW03374.1 hypothetical protein EDEG_02284 [Edhazardia aedis USNM 41457]
MTKKRNNVNSKHGLDTENQNPNVSTKLLKDNKKEEHELKIECFKNKHEDYNRRKIEDTDDIPSSMKILKNDRSYNDDCKDNLIEDNVKNSSCDKLEYEKFASSSSRINAEHSEYAKIDKRDCSDKILKNIDEPKNIIIQDYIENKHSYRENSDAMDAGMKNNKKIDIEYIRSLLKNTKKQQHGKTLPDFYEENEENDLSDQELKSNNTIKLHNKDRKHNIIFQSEESNKEYAKYENCSHIKCQKPYNFDINTSPSYYNLKKSCTKVVKIKKTDQIKIDTNLSVKNLKKNKTKYEDSDSNNTHSKSEYYNASESSNSTIYSYNDKNTNIKENNRISSTVDEYMTMYKTIIPKTPCAALIDTEEFKDSCDLDIATSLLNLCNKMSTNFIGTTNSPDKNTQFECIEDDTDANFIDFNINKTKEIGNNLAGNDKKENLKLQEVKKEQKIDSEENEATYGVRIKNQNEYRETHLNENNIKNNDLIDQSDEKKCFEFKLNTKNRNDLHFNTFKINNSDQYVHKNNILHNKCIYNKEKNCLNGNCDMHNKNTKYINTDKFNINLRNHIQKNSNHIICYPNNINRQKSQHLSVRGSYLQQPRSTNLYYIDHLNTHQFFNRNYLSAQANASNINNTLKNFSNTLHYQYNSQHHNQNYNHCNYVYFNGNKIFYNDVKDKENDFRYHNSQTTHGLIVNKPKKNYKQKKTNVICDGIDDYIKEIEEQCQGYSKCFEKNIKNYSDYSKKYLTSKNPLNSDSTKGSEIQEILEPDFNKKNENEDFEYEESDDGTKKIYTHFSKNLLNGISRNMFDDESSDQNSTYIPSKNKYKIIRNDLKQLYTYIIDKKKHLLNNKQHETLKNIISQLKTLSNETNNLYKKKKYTVT